MVSRQLDLINQATTIISFGFEFTWDLEFGAWDFLLDAFASSRKGWVTGLEPAALGATVQCSTN